MSLGSYNSGIVQLYDPQYEEELVEGNISKFQ